jgi:energy-coupling factor transporter ATP-binding protein EcfA2
MFLQRIVLENVRSVRRLELDLTRVVHDDEVDLETPLAPDARETRKWTYILGENGTGKSTLLKAVALVLAGSEALPELLGEPRDWVRFGENEARIEADYVTADGSQHHAAMTLGVEDSIRGVYERNVSLLEGLDAALAHTNQSYFTVGYGVSRRPSSDDGAFSKGGSRFRHPRARSVATLFSPHANLNSLESWAMDLDYRREGGMEIVREALDTMLRGVRFSHIDKDRRELVFETADGPTPFRLLSDGYQTVAAWTGDLLAQITEVFDDHTEPLEARGLLLIDEIGLHLHPKWQRELRRFIDERLPNMQVVATTHSALTAHQADQGELFFLRRDTPEAPVSLHQYEGAPRRLRIDQLLTSPAFGLTTLDSAPVEMLKDEYRTLRDRPARSDSEDERFLELTEQIADLPDASAPASREDEMTDLLKEVKSALEQ